MSSIISKRASTDTPPFPSDAVTPTVHPLPGCPTLGRIIRRARSSARQVNGKNRLHIVVASPERGS